jgi:hypothetical protein
MTKKRGHSASSLDTVSSLLPFASECTINCIHQGAYCTQGFARVRMQFTTDSLKSLGDGHSAATFFLCDKHDTLFPVYNRIFNTT